MFKTLKVAAAVAALSLGASAVQAGPVLVVDSFTTPQSQLVDPLGGSGTWSQVSTAGSDILGGYRDLYVESTNGGDFGVSVTDAMVAINTSGDGVLNSSADAGAKGKVLIRWDGSNAAAATATNGLGNLDLLADGYTGFSLSYKTGSTNIPMTMSVWTGGTEYQASTATVNTGGSFSDYIFSFGDFGGANFADVGAISLLLDATGGAGGFDVTLTMVRAVPEPSSVALLGMALLGLGAARRRKS